jgi:hypothetical protein
MQTKFVNFPLYENNLSEVIQLKNKEMEVTEVNVPERAV